MNRASDSVMRQSFLSGLDGDGQALYCALKKVEKWVEEHNYEAYEPFDGLSSPLRLFTFRIELLERFLGVDFHAHGVLSHRRDAHFRAPHSCYLPALPAGLHSKK